MPFGKHRGKTLDQIDTSYLCWLLGRDYLMDCTRDAIVDQLGARCGRRWRSQPRAGRPAPAATTASTPSGEYAMPFGEHVGARLAEIGSSNRGLAYLRRLRRGNGFGRHDEARLAVAAYLDQPAVRDARRRVNRRGRPAAGPPTPPWDESPIH